MLETLLEQYFVGNKAKGRILKRVLQENKARQIFRKTNISYPLIGTRAIWSLVTDFYQILKTISMSLVKRLKEGPTSTHFS